MQTSLACSAGISEKAVYFLMRRTALIAVYKGNKYKFLIIKDVKELLLGVYKKQMVRFLRKTIYITNQLMKMT